MAGKALGRLFLRLASRKSRYNIVGGISYFGRPTVDGLEGILILFAVSHY